MMFALAGRVDVGSAAVSAAVGSAAVAAGESALRRRNTTVGAGSVAAASSSAMRCANLGGARARHGRFACESNAGRVVRVCERRGSVTVEKR